MASRADTLGLIGDLMRLGVIETVDLASARATVRMGDVLSPPVPWLELAGAFRAWVPPSQGEQVLLLCPEGDIAHGIVLRGLHCTAFPAPRDDGIARLLMPDGTAIDYDPDGNVLAIALAGSCTIDAPAGVHITGDVTIEGDVSVDGNIHLTGTTTADTDVIADGIHLKTHKHSDVQSGASQTGAPV